jgi:hypothetical protein
MAATTLPQPTTPRRRGRPRKTPINPQFPGKVIRFDSRPRLVVGDVVELCRNCLPNNRGKLAVITEFNRDGYVTIRSLSGPLDTYSKKTGELSGREIETDCLPENLYRRSRDLLSRDMR